MKKFILFLGFFPVYAMQNSFDKVFNNINETYEKLSPDIREKNLESGHFVTLVGKICEAIVPNPGTIVNQNNPKEALELYARLTEIVGLDWKQLTSAQRQMWNDLDAFISYNVMEIQPESIKRMSSLKREMLTKKEALNWLKAIVEKDTCAGLEWRELLAPSDSSVQNLSPKSLRKARLDVLDTYGTIQKMQ